MRMEQGGAPLDQKNLDAKVQVMAKALLSCSEDLATKLCWPSANPPIVLAIIHRPMQAVEPRGWTACKKAMLPDESIAFN